MAGGGGALSHESTKRGKASKRKKKKRVGFHMDMTPLVDITFLLLTFFMFTTTMATPQIMEMSIPSEVETDVEVRCSQLRTILVDDDNNIYWYPCDDPLEELELKNISAIIYKEHINSDEPNNIITALKVSTEADYGLIVSILDELNLAEVGIIDKMEGMKGEDGNPKKRERRFTIAKMDKREKEKLIEGGFLNDDSSD